MEERIEGEVVDVAALQGGDIGAPVSVSAPVVVWLGSLNKNRPEQWARLVAAYPEGDMFCLPSLFEPLGIVLLEAMFFGLPCER